MRIALLILTPAFSVPMIFVMFGFGALATVFAEGSVLATVFAEGIVTEASPTDGGLDVRSPSDPTALAEEAGRRLLRVGVALSLGWLFGMAFALRYPWASVVFYGLAGAVSLLLFWSNQIVIIFSLISFGFTALALAGGQELIRDRYETEKRHEELLAKIESLVAVSTPKTSMAAEPRDLL